jgi:hypothetical protein
MIVGVDPGAKGAVCGIDYETHEPEFCNIETFLDTTWDAEHIFIEKAQAMPGQGTVSMFNYGVGFGRILQKAHSVGVPYTLVHPRTWTKVMWAGTDSKLKPKQRSKQAAERLFPGVTFKGDGQIDAALIAEYGRRQLGNG